MSSHVYRSLDSWRRPGGRRGAAFGLATLLALALLTTTVGTASAVSLSLTPASATVAPGDSITLTLFASDPAPAVIGDFDIDVSFDPAFVSVVDYDPTGVLGDLMLGEAIDFSFGDVAAGVFNIAVVSTLDAPALAALQQGSLALATIELALGPVPPPGNTTSIGLFANALGDGDGLPLAIDDLQGTTLGVIPEPTTATLLGLGLACLTRRRRVRALDRRS